MLGNETVVGLDLVVVLDLDLVTATMAAAMASPMSRWSLSLLVSVVSFLLTLGVVGTGGVVALLVVAAAAALAAALLVTAARAAAATAS